MDFAVLEQELAVKTNNLYRIEVVTYEFGRFGENDWASRTDVWEYGITATVQTIKEMKEHFAQQGFYITWKTERTGEKFNREV